MLTFRTVNGLLLAGTCLCIYGTPAPLRHHHHTTSTEHSSCDGQCANTETPVASIHTTGVPSNTDRSTYGTLEQATGRLADISVKLGGEGGAADLDEGGPGPEGIAPVTQAGNGDSSHDGRSGLSDAAGKEAWSRRREADTEAAVGSSAERGATLRQSATASQLSTGSERKPGAVRDHMEDAFVTNPAMLTPSAGEKQGATVLNTQRAAPLGSSASPTSSTQPGMAWGREGPPEQEMNPWDEVDGGASQASVRASSQGKEAETNRPSSLEPASQTHLPLGGSPPSPISSSSSLFHLTTLQSAWGPEGATVSTLPDVLIPDIGPELTPRQDGPESVWTEPLRQSEVDTVGPLSQDEATEGTMSSEALPLIFEPFDDVTPEGAGTAAAATLAPGGSEPLAAMATRGMPLSEANLDQLVAVDTGSDGPSHAPSLLLPDWTSPWQTSGAELPEPINPSGPSVAPPPADTETELTEDPAERDAHEIQNPGETQSTLIPSFSTFKSSVTTLAKAAHRPVSKSRSGLEELESEEEPDEDEEDENTEESDEDESEEDLTETPKPASTRTPYSLIPPPPVWVQRNQGLMRSWMELIREKAGYVSGMLAPVGIGIAGALLIVGALYSIRIIHRKRKNSFKHQRRKARQPEQPREPGASRQDQAMLLADSSEDEF